VSDFTGTYKKKACILTRIRYNNIKHKTMERNYKFEFQKNNSEKIYRYSNNDTQQPENIILKLV